jgi:RimJ/RimL family protein N-acetyltransferase
MKKCGMIKEAEFKEYQPHENILKDRVEYRLLKHEWKRSAETALPFRTGDR